MQPGRDGHRVPGKHTKFPGRANSVGWRAPPPGGLRRAEPLHLDFDTQTDKDLAALATAGNERAFAELLRRYERPIFSLIYRMVRDRALAEDLAQEAFIRAFNAVSSYDPRYKFSSWIFKIANNHTIDHLRRRKLDTVSIDGSPHARTAQEEEQTRLVVESTDENPQGICGAPGSSEIRSSKRSASSVPNIGPPFFCATWRGIRTKRFRKSWICLWERSKRICTVPEVN